ncbi:homocysteine S-methyltransferase [Domibacillus sp. DTU_2020_1001157_1_SI_ALB_TIR_016]|uniref:homocysteine S-methyltransferase n=1 Tax=Domibacillus sp. DTU_2020_1001157_1_SI_ALB_TIR_016 TaxID=3077789 RepID=UPI0028E1BD8F|nr:homocysteine S-methyltransferase [Domibacillus sp. DTU_2020_1001157_1_SI_ALB_TIR_016]WNS81309.1 homocysteine S-methyltransferase [Domibacillus sp. DTU_2020_1001157_1_SI_ALB_TIR_016]
MNPIQSILTEFPVIVLDGAMATELERHGCQLNDSLWSARMLMETPELIKQVHLDYFRAGADCAITASYQATIDGFAQYGLTAEETINVIQASVRIAAQARDEFWQSLDDKTSRPKPLVAASVGPYGAFLADGSEYRGDYKLTQEELIEFHRPRIQALIEAGADLLACETIPNLTEASALARLLQEEFPETYAWISFSAKDGQHISSGERIADCAGELESVSQIAAIGVNCTAPEFMPELIGEIKRASSKPVIVYPNLGEVYDAETKTWSGAPDMEAYSQHTRHWHECGAQLIGGCCRTKPSDIETIAHWVRA